MQMRHGLPRLRAAVGNHPEVGNAQIPRHLGDDLKGMGHNGGVLRGNLTAGANMRLRDHQKMGGRLGINVTEREDLIILVHLLGRDLTRRDLAE